MHTNVCVLHTTTCSVSCHSTVPKTDPSVTARCHAGCAIAMQTTRTSQSQSLHWPSPEEAAVIGIEEVVEGSNVFGGSNVVGIGPGWRQPTARPSNPTRWSL